MNESFGSSARDRASPQNARAPQWASRLLRYAHVSSGGHCRPALGDCGQVDEECCADSLDAADGEPAVVCLDDRFRDREAEPDARDRLFLRTCAAEEPVEELRLLALCYAHS